MSLVEQYRAVDDRLTAIQDEMDVIWKAMSDDERRVVDPSWGLVMTSATHEPRQGQRVKCCGDLYVLTHKIGWEWWGVNLGPPDKDGSTRRTPTFLSKVPRPFLFDFGVSP